MRKSPYRVLPCAAALILTAATAVAGHRHRGTTTNQDEPRTCADIDVEFDDRPAVRAEERATIPAGGATRFEAAENSGITIREGDRSDFEVLLCKAAPSEASLPAISLSHSGGKVSVNGPRDDDWAGHLIITAPRGAALEISAYNGPIDLIGLSGRVTARTENGPISSRGSTGELDLEAENGPISFLGESGHSKLRTQNGPIGVKLQGRSWSGDGLDARAVNGPVSLSIPSGYASGAVVESRGRSPFQCRGEGCGSAKKTWDDDGRRIEVGDGPALVHLATVNGPVSVRTGSAAGEDED